METEKLSRRPKQMGMKSQRSKWNSNRIYFQRITERDLKGRSHGQNRASPTCVRNTKIREHTQMQMWRLKNEAQMNTRKKKQVLQVIVPEELWTAAICFTHRAHTKNLTLLSVPNYAWMESLNQTAKGNISFPRQAWAALSHWKPTRMNPEPQLAFSGNYKLHNLEGNMRVPQTKQVPKTHRPWGKHLSVWQIFKAGIFKLLCWTRTIY